MSLQRRDNLIPSKIIFNDNECQEFLKLSFHLLIKKSQINQETQKSIKNQGQFFVGCRAVMFLSDVTLNILGY